MAGSAVIGALRVNLSINTAEFTENLKGVRATLNRVGKQAQQWGAGLTASISAPLTLAAGAITAAAGGLAKDVSELQKAAQISNVGFEEFQKLAFAAKSVGFEGDKLADIFKDVNDRLGDFNATGAGPMKDFFEKIGPKVGVTAAAFKDLSGPQALQLYYDSLKKAGVSQQEMIFYMEAMASDATALIPLLAKGGEGFRNLGKGAAVISEDQAKGLNSYNDAMRAMGEAVKALTIALATSGILEFVTDLVQGATGLIQSLSQTNPEMLKWGVAVAGVAAAMGPAIAGLGLFLTAVSIISAPVLVAVAAGVALAATALAIYTNWDKIKASFPVIAQVVESAIEIIKISFSGVLENARLMAKGIIQILTLDFAGAWRTAQELVNNFWTTFAAIADTIIPGFSARVAELLQMVTQLAADIVNAFMNMPAQMLEIGKNVMQGLWNGIQSMASTVVDGAKSIAGNVISKFKGVFDTHSPSRVMHEVGINVMQGLNNGMQSMEGQILATSGGVASNVEASFDSLDGIGNNLAGTFSSAFKSILDGSKSIKQVLADVLSQLADMAINSVFQSIFGGGKKSGGTSGGGSFFADFLGSIFGFERGGSIMPGGAGGIDSQLVMFRKSPNERVDITKPGQTLQSGRGDAGIALSISFDESGNPIARAQQVARSEARDQSSKMVSDFSSRVLPGRMREINKNPRKVG